MSTFRKEIRRLQIASMLQTAALLGAFGLIGWGVYYQVQHPIRLINPTGAMTTVHFQIDGLPRSITYQAEYIAKDGMDHDGLPASFDALPFYIGAKMVDGFDQLSLPMVTKYFATFTAPSSDYVLRFQLKAEAPDNLHPEEFVCTPKNFSPFYVREGSDKDKEHLRLGRDEYALAYRPAEGYYCEL